MNKTVFGILMLFCIDALASPPVLPAEVMNSMKGPAGRYQMVRLNNTDRGEASVMILDTANGDLWQWVANPAAKSSGDVKMKLIYMGHVEPGTRMGQVMDKGAYSPQ